MAGSNLPLPGLFEASSRMKGEDMSSIFARATTHRYMQSQHAKHYADVSQSSPPLTTCDFRTNLQQVVATATCTTSTSDTMSMIAPTSNPNMYLSASSYMNMVPSTVNPQSMARDQDTLQLLHVDPENEAYSLISPASFSEIMLHAMEISEANRNRIISEKSLPDPETSSDDQAPSITKGRAWRSKGPMIQKFLAVTAQSDPSHCPNSPSKQDSSVLVSAEDSDGDQKLSSNNGTKRRNCGHRKSQQKRVVQVPFCENKQRGEPPPSDTWAWRKYGQKPIKGSPYPRGYYRCSSSKGCPARKQVERSRSDPSMVMVTYTAEHNHPAWPLNKQSSSSKAGNQAEKNQGAMENSSSHVHHHNAENIFSSIINSPNGVEEQAVSSMGPLHEAGESFLLQRDVDLCLSRTSSREAGDDVFDNLGELPELSAIFSKGYIVDEYFDEEKFKHSELLY
ncbi:hypothetical protein GOP47_0024720 [Adiantum capillus-veneris]|uniref:WRKY domain-containing protein n=1 Tax=Adiantum capillus-veneris TaxID=13818 RepID=A0A9D4U3F7_ADICA|nr:hypothetical protein GOP47_0024720 [Adiantum capillus-veneris]